MDIDRLHRETFGPASAPTVVLVHGAPDRSGSFRPLLPYLRDFQVVIYDRRGYGRSVGAEPPRGLADHADDLLGVLAGLEPPRVVVAHSFGSNPTMLAATMKPDAFAAIGLWEPPLAWVGWWPETTKAYNAAIAVSTTPEADVEQMYERLLGRRAWAALPARVRARRRAEAIAFQRDMASEIAAPFAFESVSVPALVGHGTATSDEHERGAQWLARQLPRARTHVIPGAGHFAPRTHPEQYAGFIRATVALPAGSSGAAGCPPSKATANLDIDVKTNI